MLDVGRGPGTITVDLASRVAPGRVTGLDASADVVAQAAPRDAIAQRAFVDGRRVRPDVRAMVSSTSCTRTRCCSTWTGPSTCCASSGRVRAPEGLVAARDVDYEGVIWYPLIPALDEWLDPVPTSHRSVAGEPAAGRRLKAWAREAGLTDIRVHGVAVALRVARPRQWWGGIVGRPGAAVGVRRFGARNGRRRTRRLQRISDGWREWAAADDGWLLMPHGEILAHGPRR